MSPGLLVAGVLAWAGVIVLALLMAEWGEPVWGFFPVAIAVVVAWAIGEYVTDVVWKAGRKS